VEFVGRDKPGVLRDPRLIPLLGLLGAEVEVIHAVLLPAVF